MTPIVFGYPLWRGKIKKRVAKKYLRRFRNAWLMNPVSQEKLRGLTIGSYVNDCSGLNGQIREMSVTYRRVGKGHGSVLLDVEFQTSNTGCCLGSCGVSPALPREVVESRFVRHHKEWTLGEGGKTWFGEGSDDYKNAVNRANLIIQTVESGGHITDDFGQILPQFQR